MLKSVSAPYDSKHWEAIRPELERRKSRRSIVWPWYFLASAMMFSLTFLFWQGVNSKPHANSESWPKPSSMKTALINSQKPSDPKAPEQDAVPVINTAHAIAKQPLKKDQQTLYRNRDKLEGLPVQPPQPIQLSNKTPQNQAMNISPNMAFTASVFEPISLREAGQMKVEPPAIHPGPSLQTNTRGGQLNLSSGVGLAISSWFNPEEGRVWYHGAASEFSVRKGPWSLGVSPALLRTNENYKDEWLLVDVDNGQVEENGWPSFSPMTVYQKQRIAFAPEHQLVLPLHLSYSYSLGRMSCAIGPQGGLIYGWGEQNYTETFMGIQAAIGVQLGINSALRLSYSYGRPFSDTWTEMQLASLTFNHSIR